LKPSAKLKTIAVCISVLLTLAALEGALRVVFSLRGDDIRRYQPSSAYNATLADKRRFIPRPFLPYAARPLDARTLYVYRPDKNQTYSCAYALNSLGFRTPERPFHKGPGVKRIVTLGGSTTVDGFTDDATWPARLEVKLNDYYRDRGVRVEVVNLAMDMAASPTSLVDLAFVGVEYEPDLVISYDGVNDIPLVGREGAAPDYRNIYARFDDSYQSFQSRLPAWAFRSYLVTWASLKLDVLRGGASDIGSQVMRADKLKPSKDPIDGVAYFERNIRLMRGAAREYGSNFMAATAHRVAPPTKSALSTTRRAPSSSATRSTTSTARSRTATGLCTSTASTGRGRASSARLTPGLRRSGAKARSA
jgi:hypothetical protein